MDILISGINGFVGRNLNNYLLRKNHTIFKYSFTEMNDYSKNNCFAFVHLAGKAHDLTNHKSDNYYQINTDLTKVIFNNFLLSNATVFIFISTVKAVADKNDDVITEDMEPNPLTDYGKSKLLAEKYILNTKLPPEKRVFILRPCMIHGPFNKGNLNFLIKLVKLRLPWPLGSFQNKRSFCSVDNLCFIINELISNVDINSGIYNIADDNSISTNELIRIISKTLKKRVLIIHLPKRVILFFTKFFDIFHVLLTSERLNKLTENYVVSNQKIKTAIKKDLPFSTVDGLIKTIKSI